MDFFSGDIPRWRYVSGIYTLAVVGDCVVRDVDVVNIWTELDSVDVAVVEGVGRDGDVVGRDKAELTPE